CRVFREAKALGVLKLRRSGREPARRPDLEILVAEADGLALYTSLITSAYRLTKERLAGLKAAGLDHVQISIQGADAELSDAVAGTASYRDKIAAYHYTRELGFPLTVNVVLHRRNLHQVEALIRLAESLGAERIELANTQFYGWAFHNRDALMPTKAQLEAAWAVVQRERQRLGGRLEIVWVLPDYHEQFPKPCMGGWGRAYMTVTPAGEVWPCHAAGRITTLRFESVRERPLEWIWHESEAFNRFRGESWLPDPRPPRPRPRRQPGRVLRLPRAQRRREDHHRPSARHPAQADARHGPRRRLRCCARRPPDTAQHRPRLPGDDARPRPHGGGKPPLRRAAVGPAGPAGRPTDCRAARAVRVARAAARSRARAVRRYATRPRHRPWHPAPAARPVPRRAHRRPRPSRPALLVGADPAAAPGVRPHR